MFFIAFTVNSVRGFKSFQKKKDECLQNKYKRTAKKINKNINITNKNS